MATRWMHVCRFEDFSTRLVNSALLLYLGLGLLLTACSNAGVELNSNPVVLEIVSMDLGEADQLPLESGELDDAIQDPGL